LRMNMKRKIQVWVLGACFAACGAGASQAASGKEIAALPVEDVLNMRYLGGSKKEFSPDGKWLAYPVTLRHSNGPRDTEDDAYLRTGVVWDALGSDIWIVDLKSGRERNLTGGKGNNWLPCWSPDGRYLAFLSDRDESGQAKLWVWDAQRNLLKKAADVAVRTPGPGEIEWTRDSRNAVVTIVPTTLSVAEYVAKVAAVEPDDKERDANKTLRSTAIVYTSASTPNKATPVSDPLLLQDDIHDLAVVDVTRGTLRTLVHGERIGRFHVFENGSSIAYSSPQRFDKPGSQQVLHSLVVVPIATGERKVVASNVKLDLAGNFSVSPDGSKIAFRTTGEADRTFDIYAVDVNSKEIRNLSHFRQLDGLVARKQRWSYGSTLLWDAEGEHIYSVTDGGLFESSLAESMTKELARIKGRQIRQLIADSESLLAVRDHSTVVIVRDDELKQDGFYRIDLANGEATKLLERGECYTCEAGPRGHLAAVSSDGQQIVYTAEDVGHAADLWVSDVCFRNPAQLTHLNPKINQYKMGAALLIDWSDDDGHPLRGGLLLPSDYQEGKRYPLLVLVYGGEVMSDYLRTFGGFERGMPHFNVQLLATRGYAVLMPDAPQHMGTPMLDLAKTILPGVNRVIGLGIADGERIGVLGHSYGGYSTLALLVQTNRFKAAMAADGMGNLISLYGEMDKSGVAYGTSSETGQELVGGNPWNQRDRYIENSPFFYLDRVETPLLLVHGSEDTTFASFLADEVFVALRRLGKVVEYVNYKGEDHNFVNYENQLDFSQRMIRWFDGHLKTAQ
jgi:dipeptidyl aminopeptidase/acylaminoacyl peptidase